MMHPTQVTSLLHQQNIISTQQCACTSSLKLLLNYKNFTP